MHILRFNLEFRQIIFGHQLYDTFDFFKLHFSALVFLFLFLYMANQCAEGPFIAVCSQACYLPDTYRGSN